MTRIEQIQEKASELGQKYFPNEHNVWARENIEAKYVELAFIEGVKWADENPNQKITYTKEELIKMGFSFDLNGNIRTPEECYESAVKYNEYRKQKFIKKACEWLGNRDIMEKILHCRTSLIDDYVKEFRKAMNE